MYVLLVFLLISTSFFYLNCQCGKIPAIIVFGDSTVDAGNNNFIPTLLRSNFKPYGRDFLNGQPTGRFCNGRLAPDFISEALGLPPIVPAYLDPAYDIKDFAKGVCFASAGTGFDNATSDVLSVIPLWKEVEYFREYQTRLRRYMGKPKAKWTISESVYIISIGTNDFLENYFSMLTQRFKQFTVEEFQDYVLSLAVNFITEIYNLGARKISFTALSPMGCLPLERTTNLMHGGSCIEEYNNIAIEFNAKLRKKINEISVALPGIRLKYASPYDKLLHIINNPGVYGIDNVNEGCCGTGRFEMGFLCNSLNPKTCADADKYMFWDAFHPTEKVNRIMAELTLETSLREFI